MAPTQRISDKSLTIFYFRFQPGPEAPVGIVGTPLMGDVVPERIYSTHRPEVADALSGHPEWKPVDKREYDAQTQADERSSKND